MKVFNFICVVLNCFRSESCPQCRGKTTERTIIKLHFSNDCIYYDLRRKVLSLHNRIGDLISQLNLKDADLSNFMEESTELENEIQKVKSAIHAFEEQIKRSGEYNSYSMQVELNWILEALLAQNSYLQILYHRCEI